MNEGEVTERAPGDGMRRDRKPRSLTRRTMLPLVAGAVLFLMAVAQCMLLGAFLAGQENPVASDSILLVSYSDFQAQVVDGNVAWVTLDTTASNITGGLRHPIPGASQQGGAVTSDRVATVYPLADSASLRAELQAHGVAILTSAPSSATGGSPVLLVSALVCGGAVLALALGSAFFFLGILRLMHPGAASSATARPGDG